MLDAMNKNTPIITLRELLSDNSVYRVPDYQRGYSWNKEFDVLWDDIVRLYKLNSKNHYTGMLVLKEMNSDDKTKENISSDCDAYYIVDGQQRITSLIIIIAALMLNINPCSCDSDSYIKCNGYHRFGYANNESNKELSQYFEETIYASEYKENNPKNSYMVNIKYASEYIRRRLYAYSSEKWQDLLDLILDKIVFNIFILPKDGINQDDNKNNFDVRVTFETMNNRGKSLSSFELLKNRLMYLTTLFNEDVDSLRTDIYRIWADISEELLCGVDNLYDDEFLKAHWIIYSSIDRVKGYAFISDIFDNHFAINKFAFSQCKKEIIANYINNLKECSKVWAYINRPEYFKYKNQNYINIHNNVAKLSRLTSNLYVRTAVMVVAANQYISDKDKNLFFDTLEKSWFMYKTMRQDESIDYSFLITAARALFKSVGINDAQDKFDKLYKALYEHDKVGLSIKNKKETIQEFAKYIEDKNYDYFSWGGIKYFLNEYNNSLDETYYKGRDIDYSKMSIEHILPRTPSSTEKYWTYVLSEYKNDNDNIFKVTNCLGNLVLVRDNKENSSLSNKAYNKKRAYYRNSTKAAYEISINNDIWTIQQIKENNEKLLNFLYTNWFCVYDSEDEEILKSNSYYKKGISGLIDMACFKVSKCKEIAKEIKNNFADYENDIIEVKDSEINSADNDVEIFKKALYNVFDGNANIKINKGAISYTKDCFTFLFNKTNTKIKIGALINGNKVYFEYNMKENKMYYNVLEGEQALINIFINCFNTAVRKSLGKPNPIMEQWNI